MSRSFGFSYHMCSCVQNVREVTVPPIYQKNKQNWYRYRKKNGIVTNVLVQSLYLLYHIGDIGSRSVITQTQANNLSSIENSLASALLHGKTIPN